MLILYRNNRMELLLDALGDVLSRPRRETLCAELIVVQSLGMERWLSMGLADRFGIWANAEYPFPRAFIQNVSDLVTGTVPESRRYTRESMALHLADILGSLPADPALLPLRQYLAARTGITSRLDLAGQLADAFDQIQIYRPEWLFAWESSAAAAQPSDLMPALFRVLRARLGEQHFPNRIGRVIDRLERGDFPRQQMPERLCLFGVASLPPAYIRVLDALARHVPVHWFLLTASREYIGDERMARRMAGSDAHDVRIGRAHDDGSEIRQRSSHQPLLAGCGRIMCDIGLLVERDCQYLEGAAPDFVEPETDSVLRTLQADLCALRHRGTAPEAPRLVLDPSDRSLQVHACHGPRRELEVLRELLLDAFERDPTLLPEDVIVLLRDVETYAPLVDAVFAVERGQVGHIPYVLSDRTMSTSNFVAEALVSLLELGRQRMTAARLLQLIERVPIRSRFGLTVGDLPKIRAWIMQLHVTWGVDLDDRARVGSSGQPEQTLRFGLSRLLLGAARSSSAGAVWRGLLPLDVEGDDAALAGRFVECAEMIFAWREVLAQPRSFAEWQGTIAAAIRELFLVEAAQAWQLAGLFDMLSVLSAEAESAGFSEAIPAEVVANRVRQHFDGTRTAHALCSGGVTFCAMLPMRGIPARVVAMVGLDDGKFPRSDPRSSFDAVAQSPSRPGDRLGRDEDRHLFLETLLAARERLIVTYQGRNPRDDSILPRSVVVDELLAVVDESYEIPDAPAVRPSQRLVIEHPLHAHSPRYFDGKDPRLILRNEREFLAAVASEQSQGLPGPAMTVPLSPVQINELDLTVLERFWMAPAEFFYRERLGAFLEREPARVEVLDPIEVDGLERYQLSLEQLQSLARGQGQMAALADWTAGGHRPFSTLGEVVYSEQAVATEQLYRVLSQLTNGAAAPLRELSVPIDQVLVTAEFVDCFSVGRIDWSPAQIRASHRIRAWLRHLLLGASGFGMPTFILRRGTGDDHPIDIERLAPVAEAEAIELLELLVRAYRFGQRAPLPFFPDLAWDYAVSLRRGDARASALERAWRAYGDPSNRDDDEFKRPVGPWAVLRLFGAEPPLADDWSERFGIPHFPVFSGMAEQIFLPYLACRESVELDDLLQHPAGQPPGRTDAGGPQ